MCTKLICTTELVIFSAAVVCGGGSGELLNLWQWHCILPDQMMRVMILNDSNVDVPLCGLPRDALSKNDTVTVL